MFETFPYQVLDADGYVVWEGQGALSTNHCFYTMEYEGLCDLPVGQYTLEPGAVPLTVLPREEPM